MVVKYNDLEFELKKNSLGKSSLFIENQDIFEISALNGLEKLTNLDNLTLNNCKIKEINGIDHLQNLTQLTLESNQIEKIDGLESLSNLKLLNLRHNNIEKITGLDHLRKLETLGLCYNKVSRVENLESLISLKRVSFYSCSDLREIHSFGNLRNLNLIYLTHCKIRELKGFDGLEKLLYLDVENNLLTEIKNLEPLKKLIWLNLSVNQIEEIKGLEELRNLRRLELENNNISEIKGLENLRNLEWLALWNNKITQLKGLENLTSLKGTRINRNPFNEEAKKILGKGTKAAREYCIENTKVNIFINFANSEYQKFQIADIKKFLLEQKEINEVFLKESESNKNRLENSNIMLFVASRDSVFNSSDCKLYIEEARKNSVGLIPIKFKDVNWIELRSIGLSRELGIEFSLEDFESKLREIYIMIQKYRREYNVFDPQFEKVNILRNQLQDALEAIFDSYLFTNFIMDYRKKMAETIKEDGSFNYQVFFDMFNSYSKKRN